MLPHSLEAEKSVLGGMLISREAAELVCEALKPEDFYLPAHQDIYAAMLQLYNRGNAVDSVTLIDALEREGKLNAVGSVSYITELSLFVPSAANVSHYIRIVEDRSVMRQLIRAGTDIVQDAQTGERPVGDMLDDAERRIFNISMKKSEDTLVHIEKTAMDTYFHIGELMALKGKLSGITTGFTDLDRLTSGLQRSDLIIVAGRPSMGKTAFALNVAQNAALKGATICIFSLEMSREQLVRRMLCANAGVDMQRVNTGNTTDADLIELSTALADLSATNIYIDDTAGVSVAEIRSRCRKQKSRGGLDLIVIDYLQLMKTAGNSDNRATEISDVTRSLKILARELNVPIMFSAMSYGSISYNAHASLARAACALGTYYNTGEGGLHKDFYQYGPHTIVQVASGRFGVHKDYLEAGAAIEIKMGQGAKPGIGGHLPGLKVGPDISKTRMIPEGTDAISPAPHHDIYSIEDLRQLVFSLKEATEYKKPVMVKIAAVHNVAAIASGVARSGADVICIDGYRGGTGAAPTRIRDNVGIPIELALAAVDQRLRDEGIRDQVSVVVGGSIRNSADLLKAIALGADACYIATSALLAMGCHLCRTCQTGKCNWGIATQRPDLVKRLNPDIGSQRLINLVTAWDHELKEMMGGMGINSIEALRGNRLMLRGIGLNDRELNILGIKHAGE